MPKVTVLMPVYNAERYLKESIKSILNQTFTDFEFLIINDGSTDKSVEIIESFKDSRIRLVHNEQNMNLVPTLNRGLELSLGEYIARMDGDDIAYPERLQKQVDFMDNNVEIGICGSWIQFFDGADGVIKYPTLPEEIKSQLFFVNSLAHPTVIMRKALLQEYNLKYERRLAEDYDLWQRASFCFKLANIPEVLLDYRISPGSYSNTYSPKVAPVILEMIKEMLKKFNIFTSEEELSIHRSIGNGDVFDSEAKLLECIRYLHKVITANKSRKIYPSKNFLDLCNSYIYNAIFKSHLSRKIKIKYIIRFLFLKNIFRLDFYKNLYKLITKK